MMKSKSSVVYFLVVIISVVSLNANKIDIISNDVLTTLLDKEECDVFLSSLDHSLTDTIFSSVHITLHTINKNYEPSLTNGKLFSIYN